MSRQLRTLIQRLQSLTQEKLERGFVTKFNAKSQTLEGLNRKHLREGKLATGKDIINLNDGESTFGTNRYSSSYVKKRKAGRKTPQEGPVVLKFDGDFYANTKYKKESDGGTLSYEGSDKKKEKYIDQRYGEDIVGILDSDLDEITELVAQQVTDAITAKFTNI
jgi:hypothetical protein